jgi:hypothetical protein
MKNEKVNTKYKSQETNSKKQGAINKVQEYKIHDINFKTQTARTKKEEPKNMNHYQE